MSYSSNQNEFNNITREKLDSMSTAELLELLENINETMTEDNFNNELVTACLDALDKKVPVPEHMTDEESWQSFKDKLKPDRQTVEDGKSDILIPKRGTKRFLRAGLIAAIIMFCLFSCMILAQAAGVDVFGAIARWTDSVFGFGEIGVVSEALTTPSSGVDKSLEKIEPWLLNVSGDFAMGVPEILSDPISGVIMYSVQYQSDENILLFDAITKPDDNTESLFEKDNNVVKEVLVRDIPVYIFTNNSESVAAWYVDGIEFSISTNLDVESLASLVINSYGG